MSKPHRELNPPVRLMMTPGPLLHRKPGLSRAGHPACGPHGPGFAGAWTRRRLLREIFQTENRVTFRLPLPARAALKQVLNSLEPGDEAICCVNGTFSERMYVIAQHTPARARRPGTLRQAGRPGRCAQGGEGPQIKMIGLPREKLLPACSRTSIHSANSG